MSQSYKNGNRNELRSPLNFLYYNLLIVTHSYPYHGAISLRSEWKRGHLYHYGSWTPTSTSNSLEEDNYFLCCDRCLQLLLFTLQTLSTTERKMVRCWWGKGSIFSSLRSRNITSPPVCIMRRSANSWIATTRRRSKSIVPMSIKVKKSENARRLCTAVDVIVMYKGQRKRHISTSFCQDSPISIYS